MGDRAPRGQRGSYLSNPTSKQASLVTLIAYTPGVIPEGYGYWAPDLDILRNQVQGGDSEAFRLTYRLIQKADGSLLEELIVILSHTVRVRPEFFLRELCGLKPSLGTLRSILLMPGLEYTDRPGAQRYELEMRAKAIEAVKTAKLKSFRDRCLVILKKE